LQRAHWGGGGGGVIITGALAASAAPMPPRSRGAAVRWCWSTLRDAMVNHWTLLPKNGGHWLKAIDRTQTSLGGGRRIASPEAAPRSLRPDRRGDQQRPAISIPRAGTLNDKERDDVWVGAFSPALSTYHRRFPRRMIAQGHGLDLQHYSGRRPLGVCPAARLGEREGPGWSA